MVLPRGTQSSKTFGSGTNPSTAQPGPRSLGSNAGSSFFGGTDWSGVEEGGFAQMDPGWYEMYVESVETGTSSAGNPQLVFTFQALYDMDGNEVSGRPKYWMTKTEKSLPFVMRDMNALGVHPSQVGNDLGVLRGLYVQVLMGKNVGGNDPERIVARELRPTRMFEQGTKFTPARPGVPQ